jgi:hypothetical protein
MAGEYAAFSPWLQYDLDGAVLFLLEDLVAVRRLGERQPVAASSARREYLKPPAAGLSAPLSRHPFTRGACG